MLNLGCKKKVSKFIFLYIMLIMFPLAPLIAFENPTDNLQVEIPGLNRLSDPGPCPDEPDKTCVPWIAEYTSAVYKYAVGISGILAVVVMMFGGILWIAAGGNTERVASAKAWIGAALTGLVLVLLSYSILYLINPDLVGLKATRIDVVTPPRQYEADVTVTIRRCRDEQGRSRCLSDEICENVSGYSCSRTNQTYECLLNRPGRCTVYITAVYAVGGTETQPTRETHGDNELQCLQYANLFHNRLSGDPMFSSVSCSYTYEPI